MYPIKEDFVPEIRAHNWNARVLLIHIKRNLPFIFRYEADKHFLSGSPKYNDSL